MTPPPPPRSARRTARAAAAAASAAAIVAGAASMLKLPHWHVLLPCFCPVVAAPVRETIAAALVRVCVERNAIRRRSRCRPVRAALRLALPNAGTTACRSNALRARAANCESGEAGAFDRACLVRRASWAVVRLPCIRGSRQARQWKVNRQQVGRSACRTEHCPPFGRASAGAARSLEVRLNILTCFRATAWAPVVSPYRAGVRLTPRHEAPT